MGTVQSGSWCDTSLDTTILPPSRVDRGSVSTANTIIWRPPPQYSVDTSAWVPKYSPEPNLWPDDAPRRLGSRPLARMLGMFWGLCVINQ